MMPDLGQFATPVLASYAVSIALLVALIALSLRRSRRVRAQLADVEARKERRDV